MNTTTIKINGTDYRFKYTIRSLFIFEQITGRPFKIETLMDNYLFYYSMLLANNPDNIMTWDDFLNALDDEPRLMLEMNAIVEGQRKQTELFNATDDEGSTNDDEKKN